MKTAILAIAMTLAFGSVALADYNRWSERVLHRWGAKSYSYQHDPNRYHYGNYQSQRQNVNVNIYIKGTDTNDVIDKED